eukprot:s3864_g1.t1
MGTSGSEILLHFPLNLSKQAPGDGVDAVARGGVRGHHGCGVLLSRLVSREANHDERVWLVVSLLCFCCMFNQVRNDFVQDNPQAEENSMNLYNYFLNRLRDNLHIVLSFSPLHHKFPIRAQMFPAVFSVPSLEMKIVDMMQEENALNEPHGGVTWWKKLGKQSGIPNIQWHTISSSWVVNFTEKVTASSAKTTKTTSKSSKSTRFVRRLFPVKRFMKPSQRGLRAETQADAAALEAAKAYRKELVKQGILKDVSERRSSPIPGVQWIADRKRWRVIIQKINKADKKTEKDHKTTMKKKKTMMKNNNSNMIKIYGGCFKDQAAAEAKALAIAKQLGLQRQVKSVRPVSELPVVHPKVPCRGVKWNQLEQKWRIQCRNAKGAVVNFRVTPKDHSEAELERSFQEAVAWKEQQQGPMKSMKSKDSKKSKKSKSKDFKDKTRSQRRPGKVTKVMKVAKAKVAKVTKARNVNINWFLPWPGEALVAVSANFLKSFKIDTTEENRNRLYELMASFQNRIRDMSSTYLSRMRKHVYVTPRSFLCFIEYYKKLYAAKYNEVNVQEKSVNIGLRKLEEAAKSVVEMQVEIERQEEVLRMESIKTNELLNKVHGEKSRAEDKAEEVGSIAKDCEENASAIDADREEANRQLQEALPYLHEANAACQSIKDKDIVELKGNKAPVDIVKLTFDGLLLLMGNKVSEERSLCSMVSADRKAVYEIIGISIFVSVEK